MFGRNTLRKYANLLEMSQRSITAFFKPKGETSATEPTNYALKTSATSLKRRIVDSSSDEENVKEANKRKQIVAPNKEPSTLNHKKTDEKTIKSETGKKVSPKSEAIFANVNVKTDGSNNCVQTEKETTPKKAMVSHTTQEPSGTDYDPAKLNYKPIKDAFWEGKPNTPYLALARTFQQIEEIRGRLKMIETLSNFFCSVILLNPQDLLPCIYLSMNQLAPAYEGFELGVAEGTLMKVICKATGRDLKHIKAQSHEIGDLGIVAEHSRIAQRMMFRPAPLTVPGIFKKLKEIARLTGPAKINTIQDIFVACRFSEARYFIRSLIGKLRIGLAEQSLMQALAIALVKASSTKEECAALFTRNTDETSLILKTAYCQCPNFDKLIPTLLEHGIDELLERCPMKPGIPIKPMLAQPTKGVREVLERLDGLQITCEWKYDGERAQIHCDNNIINIYSRNQENNTSKYPDVIARTPQFRKDGVNSYIVDSEIVAWDVERKQILPFQVLSTRKRKNVDVEEIKVQVCVYAFDLLYLNGKPLVTKPFIERRQLLKEHFQEVEGEFQFATAMDTNDMDEVQQFLEESIKGNCEGLMVKTLDTEATYEIAKRSRNWLKLKKDYLSGVGDSLDLVVIGGFKGKGRRTGTYGCFLLACYDKDNEEYQSICKIGTGFSDEDLRVHASFFKEHMLVGPKSYFRFDSSMEPDDWFEPVQIWEVKCADLSLSPVHKAAVGIIDSERGISLRFPRFIRIRDDKSPEDATSAQQVAEMYSSQDQIKNQQNGATVNDDYENDFY